MKKYIANILINTAILCVLSLATITLGAQDIPLTLNISLTGTVQGADDGGNPIDRIKSSTIRISTKQVLNLLASGAYVSGFPIGTRLSLSGGSISVVDKNGNNLLPDVATINVATEVKNGQANPNTGALSHILSLALTFNFDDGNGNTFNLTGLAKGLVSLSAMDASGNQKESVSLSATVVGDGTIGGNEAVFSGVMTASGKATVPDTLKQGLIAFYPFNGNANDESGNGNNAQIAGAVLSADRFGLMNRAFHFNGAGDNISASVGSLPLGDSPRSITAWINPDTDAHPVNGVIDYGSGDCTGLIFGISFSKLNGGTPNYNDIGFWGGCQDYMSSLIAPSNHWSFVALTYDGANIHLYMNGSLETDAIGSLDTQNSHIWIGAETLDDGASFRDFFNGGIDNVRFYDRALSHSEVHTLYIREKSH